MQAVNEWLSRFTNLWLIGRQGLFLHNNTHHSLLMGYRAAQAIADGGDRAAWVRALEEFATFRVGGLARHRLPTRSRMALGYPTPKRTPSPDNRVRASEFLRGWRLNYRSGAYLAGELRRVTLLTLLLAALGGSAGPRCA